MIVHVSRYVNRLTVIFPLLSQGFIYLTPCVPLSFKGEGEEKERGAKAPLKCPKYAEHKSCP